MNFKLRQGGNQSHPRSVSPSSLKLPLGGQGDRPMSVRRHTMKANTRSQQRGGFKGEGDKGYRMRLT
ncbi:hypothetical protein [Candidatus Regiella endosymbiont of Tuberolachnus salignus]|uniref:hypothetical protein n=1 Tax=Candidatus Regiella endosymbiont of Tuberolachnus salignus TaxID=3077956 RepID=UPI0030D50433